MNTNFLGGGKVFHIYEEGNVSRSDENTIDYHNKGICLILKEKCVFRNPY